MVAGGEVEQNDGLRNTCFSEFMDCKISSAVFVDRFSEKLEQKEGEALKRRKSYLTHLPSDVTDPKQIRFSGCSLRSYQLYRALHRSRMWEWNPNVFKSKPHCPDYFASTSVLHIFIYNLIGYHSPYRYIFVDCIQTIRPQVVSFWISTWSTFIPILL